MSAFDAYSVLTTKFGQLAPMLIGEKSLFTPRFWDRSNIHVTGEDQTYQPRGNTNPQFGEQARYVFPKRATLLGTPLIEWELTAGVGPGAAPLSAAYVNNVGDHICATVTMRYGSHILQSYPGIVQQIVRRVECNEIDEDCRDELTLGNRRIGAGTLELERAQAFDQTAGTFWANGTTIYSPLDQLWFQHHFDEHWMPEAFATEAELEIDIAPIGRLVYTNAAATPPVTPPTISASRMRIREITLTAPEKAERLNYFNSEKGCLTHFLDWETQRRVAITGTGALATYRVPLDNIRLDINQLFFIVRKSGAAAPSINVDWSCDPLENDSTAASLLVGAATNLGALMDIASFRFEANGSRLTNDIPAFINRTWMRKLYHSKATSNDFIFFYSPALIPDNKKHVTGFLNAANLGNLELVINANLPAVAYEVDVFVQSHNIIQMRRGDAVKSLK